ncbi:CobW family GTP-binding protein [Arenibacterium sp. CAU 1754]
MIPVTVIGGYLGAGKTTLINHMLRHADGIRIAVLVNEFGELAIDEDLIEAEGDDLISIAGGCICCAFGDNLVGAMMDLVALSPPPDHVVIEASGVAIPGAIAASLTLVSGFRLNGVIVLADADSVRDNAQDKYLGDTILRQLRGADLVILTKTDLPDPAMTDDVRAWLADHAGEAKLIEAQHGRIPNAILLGPPDTPREYAPATHHDAAFESMVLDLDKPVDVHALANRLATGDFGIVRAKGFAKDHSGDTFLIQIVGRRVQVSQSAPGKKHAIVCIGRAGGLTLPDLQQLTASVEVQPT